MKAKLQIKSYKPLITLVIGIILSVILWSGLSYVEHTNARAEFAYETDKINEEILEQLSSFEGLLIGVKAFFMASEEVSMEEWKIYFDKLQFAKKYPGLHGLSYIKAIKSNEEYYELRDKLQLYGMNDFKIKPEGIRAEYFPVVYLEPLSNSNIKAIGYDIYSEKIRRRAIEFARDSEATCLTRKISLVQDEENDIQSGLLMMVPFFTNERIGHREAERELDGLINGVIRMDDFIRAYIKPLYFKNMRIRIYDYKVSDQNLLFDSLAGANTDSIPERFSDTVVLNCYGQNWIIKIDGQPAANYLHMSFGETRKVLNLIVLYVGYALSVIAFYLARFFQTASRLKKQKVADAISMKANMDIIRRQEDALLRFKDQSEHLIVCIIDIADSTSTTSQLTGRQAADFYSTFHNVMSEVIQFHKGSIVKLMGDAILFSFEAEAPLTKEHCKWALDCCLDLIKTHKELNSILDQKALPVINYRISSVYGSVMTASKDNVRDIFGSTVNQCSKINRYANTNGLIISKQMQAVIEDDLNYVATEVTGLAPEQHGSVLYRVRYRVSQGQ